MDTERIDLYNKILGAVQNSPIKTTEFEGNTFHFKLEYKLPYGECHYARVFSQLIYQKECLGIINPGDTLLETTSGSGGRAAAAVATALGYPIKIAIPAGGEKAREDAIVKAGAELFLTPAEAYVNGFPMFIKRFLAKHKGTKYINHVMGDITGKGDCVNIISIDAFRPFAHEVVNSGITPDIVVCPIGNGTTTLAMGEEFKSLIPTVTIVGFEAVSSALVYRKKFPGRYQSVFGIDPATIPRHDLPGTSYANPIFPFPALDACLPYIDDIRLVTDDLINENFVKAVGFKPAEKSELITKWDDFHQDFLKEFGRTGVAAFAVAATMARKKKMHDKHFLIPVCDAVWHYDK